ncbi:peptide chain release factor class I/class II, partial [Dimargaris cristalligena]
LNDNDLEEKFVKGSGNGGQKINKTNNRVQLRHLPSGIIIECQETRSLEQNRKIARKRLIAKLDELHNGDQSKIAKKLDKVRKRKSRKRQKTKKKYT